MTRAGDAGGPGARNAGALATDDADRCTKATGPAVPDPDPASPPMPVGPDAARAVPGSDVNGIAAYSSATGVEPASSKVS